MFTFNVHPFFHFWIWFWKNNFAVFVMLLYPELFNSFKSNAITAMLFKKTNQWAMIYYNEFKKGFIWYCSNDLIYITANIVWKLTKDGTTYFALETWIEILTLHTLHRDDYSIETTIRISLFSGMERIIAAFYTMSE